jgi:hypothetical protein
MAWFIVLGAMCLPACSGGPTTVMLQVSAVGSTSLQALYGQVSSPSQAGSEQQLSGPVQLPGTLTVWLPDTAEPTTIAIRGVATDGTSLRASVTLTPVPHGEVDSAVTLTNGAVGNGNGNNGGSSGVDLAPPVNPTPGAPDLGTPADLSTADLMPVVLAQDNFHRAANQTYWGTASDGLVWGADANTNPAFAIVNNTGIATDAVIESVSGTLGPSVADAEVLITTSIDTFTGGTSNNEIGAMLRWVDDNDFYKAGLNGINFRLYVRTTAGGAVTLSTIPYAASPGVLYSIRVRAVGTSFMAKVWPAAQTEPTGWMVTATDSKIAAGNCGVRLVFNSTATMTFTSFVATPAN